MIEQVGNGQLYPVPARPNLKSSPIPRQHARVLLAVENLTVKLQHVCTELTGVIRDVGLEGRLGGQAQVQGLSGTWSNLIGRSGSHDLSAYLPAS